MYGSGEIIEKCEDGKVGKKNNRYRYYCYEG